MCQTLYYYLYGDYHLLQQLSYIGTQFREEDTEALGLSNLPSSHC